MKLATKKYKLSFNKYDKIWSKKVRERDGKCLYCGKTDTLNAHHLFGRSRSATRFMLKNGITLCSLHHVFGTEFSAHRTEQTFKAWAKDYLGQEEYEALRQLSESIYPRRKAIQDFIQTLSGEE